jgi:hypothetical protein
MAEEIKANPAFEIFRADEVAECWEGVGRELYGKLWKIAVIQKPIPNIEDSGPSDHIGFECLAKHWDMLTADEQRALNVLAEAKQAEWRNWLA